MDERRGAEPQDATPWLRDEKRPAPAPPPRKRGAWWSRFIGQEGEPAPPRKTPSNVKKVIPFEDPCDAETVVASRDELLKMVRDYMASKGRLAEPAVVEERPPGDGGEEAGGSSREGMDEAGGSSREGLDEAGGSSREGLDEARGSSREGLDEADEGRLPSPPRGEIFQILEERRAMARPSPGKPESPLTGARVRPTRKFDAGADLDHAEDPRPGGASQAVPRHPLPPRPAEVEQRARAEDEAGPRRSRGLDAEPGAGGRGRAPVGPSAMSRDRVLGPPGKRPASRPVPAEDPSLSSYGTVGGANENERPYPQRFYTLGLRLLRTQRWNEALEFYGDEAKRRPFDSDGYYGLAAGHLGIGDLEQAALELAKGYEIDPIFPFGRLVVDTCPGDPLTWYNLAAVLISLRKRGAYMCAEQILVECLGGADDNRLRTRAERVKKDIARMLEARQFRDEFRRETSADPWFSYFKHPVVALAILALAAITVWLVFGRAPASVPGAAVESSAPLAAPAGGLPSRVAPSGRPPSRGAR
jgi:hypothetical protein